MGLIKKEYQDEDAAREHLEKLMWPEGAVCSQCGVIGESTRLMPKEGTKTHGRKGAVPVQRLPKTVHGHRGDHLRRFKDSAAQVAAGVSSDVFIQEGHQRITASA